MEAVHLIVDELLELKLQVFSLISSFVNHCNVTSFV